MKKRILKKEVQTILEVLIFINLLITIIPIYFLAYIPKLVGVTMIMTSIIFNILFTIVIEKYGR